MLKEIGEKDYYNLFPSSQNPFISKQFLILNQSKVDELKFLIIDEPKPSIGLVLGSKDNKLLSPYSAPFGGFHFTHSNIYIGKIEEFAASLKTYFSENKYAYFKIIFPPSIYGFTFNHKMISALVRAGFNWENPELTNYVNLNNFESRFSNPGSRKYYNQALRNELTFKEVFDEGNKLRIVDLVRGNRERSDRALRMGVKDFQDIENIFSVKYFAVINPQEEIVASAIYYAFPKDKIALGAIWGDSLSGRDLRAMDFLSFEIWCYFKNSEFEYIDLGISTEDDGIPNEGLLRFKETHEAETELRHIITLKS